MNIDNLIGEIRGLSHGRISARRRDQVIDEVRAHLDASIQARLEISGDRPLAETETVIAFGDPIEFVEKLAEKERESRREWFDRSVWKALAATTVFFMFFFCYVAQYDKWWRFLVVVYVVAIVGFATWIILASARARRPQFLPLLAAFAIGVPFAALFLSINRVTDGTWDSGLGMTRVQLQEQIRDHPRSLFTAFQAEKDFLAAADRYYFHADLKKPVAVRWHPGYGFGEVDSFVYSPAATPAMADASWKRTFANAYRSLVEEEDTASRTESDFDEQLHRPFLLNALYFLPSGEEVSQQVVEFLALFSLVGWAVSRAGRRIRANRKSANAGPHLV